MSSSRFNASLAESLNSNDSPPQNLADRSSVQPDPASAYIARQAATVGRGLTRPGPWVPRLSNAPGQCLGMLKGEGNIAAGSVALYPDGRTLVTGDPYGTIGCWNLAEGGVLRRFQGQHSAQIQDITVSPNGRLLATASSDNTIRIWSTATEQELRRCEGHGKEVLKISWAPDSTRLVSASADKSVRVWNALNGTCRHEYWGHEDGVYGVHWSLDGRFLASGSRDQTIRIWDAGSGACLHPLWLPDGATESVNWSPDGRFLATAGEDTTIRLWDTRTWTVVQAWEAHAGAHFLSCLAWSPDGRLLASGAHGDQSIWVWEAATGRPVEHFEFAESYTWRLAWSPDGGFLASKHAGAVCRLWDTRHLAAPRAPAVNTPLPAELAALPAALAQLQRLHLYPPLVLLRELLRLTGGQPVTGTLAVLASCPGVQEFVHLRWPTAARVGLVALLLRGLPPAGWQPPAGLPPGRLQEVLLQALAGESMEPCRPPYPLALLRQNAVLLDDRLLSLLALLGPEAVAAEPGLPLRLCQQLPVLPALSTPQRRLLQLRLPLDSGHHAQGSGMASARTGITRQGEWHALLPSQLVLPPVVLHSRYHRQELLYRARSGREPPRLRPTVLVLDVSPPSFGPVETTSRLAAHVIASSLLEAHLPVVLVAAGGAGRVRTLEQPADLLELWTLRSLEPAAAVPALHLARAIRASLRDDLLEPLIVLLSHPWFGAEEELPAIPALRGLFVQYPGRQIRPALGDACERWENLNAGQFGLEPLVSVLG
jgi:hypothetical protein